MRDGTHRTLGHEPAIRNADPSIQEKAAALMHSLARSRALVHERLALAAELAFYGTNGLRRTLTNDEAYDLVIAVATGQLDDPPPIAELLAEHARPRRR